MFKRWRPGGKVARVYDFFFSAILTSSRAATSRDTDGFCFKIQPSITASSSDQSAWMRPADPAPSLDIGSLIRNVAPP